MADIIIKLCDDLNLNDFNEYLTALDDLNQEQKHLIKEVFISVEPTPKIKNKPTKKTGSVVSIDTKREPKNKKNFGEATR